MLALQRDLGLALTPSPGSITRLQLRLRQARALRNVTVFKAPFRTTWYFLRYATSSVYSGAKWLASHPVTLLVILPGLIAYATAKHVGYQEDLIVHIEVRRGAL